MACIYKITPEWASFLSKDGFADSVQNMSVLTKGLHIHTGPMSANQVIYLPLVTDDIQLLYKFFYITRAFISTNWLSRFWYTSFIKNWKLLNRENENCREKSGIARIVPSITCWSMHIILWHVFINFPTDLALTSQSWHSLQKVFHP